MNDFNPLISVIIPVYNVEKYIVRCVDSLIKQTYGNFECILVENGSTDNSSRICDDLALRDLRIKVLHEKNEGVSNARNSGIKFSKGDYVVFLDGDDWFDSCLLEKAVDKIMQTDAQLIMWGISFFDGKNIYKKIVSEKDRLYINEMDFFPEWFNAPWTKMIKKTFIEENNIYFPENISMAEDMFFSYKCFNQIESIYFIKEPLYYYYNTRPDSACNSMNEKKIHDEIKCIDLLEEEFKNSAKVFTNSLFQRKKSAKERYLYMIKTTDEVNYFKNLYPEINLNVTKLIYKILYFCISNNLNLFVKLMLKVKNKR